VKPGTHKFYIRAKDTQGNYSANAVWEQVTVFYPTNYTDKATFTDDFSGGTHQNTAYKDDPTYGRVLYVNAGLQGNYTSPVYDLGSLRNIRLWTNFGIVLIGNETIWSGQYGESDAWTKHNSTWAVIFTPTLSAGLMMTLLHSPDNISWSELSYFHVYSPEVNCRYLKYRSTITNNSPDNYLYQKPVTVKAAYWN